MPESYHCYPSPSVANLRTTQAKPSLTSLPPPQTLLSLCETKMTKNREPVNPVEESESDSSEEGRSSEEESDADLNPTPPQNKPQPQIPAAKPSQPLPHPSSDDEDDSGSETESESDAPEVRLVTAGGGDDKKMKQDHVIDCDDDPKPKTKKAYLLEIAKKHSNVQKALEEITEAERDPKLASRRQFSQVMPLFMKRRRTACGAQLLCFTFLVFVLRIHGCPSFDPEGYALLQFRAKVNFDPSGALASWNPDDCSPCSWLGVHCLDVKCICCNYESLCLCRDLNGRDLVGLLVPELANLSRLRVLFLCNNGFEGRIPFEIGRLIFLSEGQCMNRKIGHCTWQSVFKRSQKSNTFQAPARGVILHYLNLYRLFNLGSESLHNQPDACGIDLPESAVRCNVDGQTNQRRILVEQSTNLVTLPPNVVPPVQLGNVAIPSRSSGSFPAVPNVKKRAPAPTGLSGQLQKAFVTGVPKPNRPELETACEDFSNIISTEDGIATVYKGTLSSGVEIAVISTAVLALEDWSKHSETAFRKKIDTLSRINHKNFVNLIGYCEEDNPFTRIMVSEYAPNGSLFEHLHVEGLDHLDWSARTRIIMGTGYCLQHMHELNPPISHFNLTSKEIFLTEDYAAKVADVGFWRDLVAKSKNPAENESEHSELPPHADAETNAAPSLNDRKNFSSLVDPTLKSHKENELEVICEVIQRCVQQDVRTRPSMREVIEMLRQAIDISPELATPRLSLLWRAELEILSAEAA
ncbi:hypothetical protein SASPL_154135 [Salvia splendens]|uniref:Protein kinase domain-containing protein n=1 Tax=Salvia splendens TaxID=180675 RepID=A0A8X8YY68_SALSN|nr:hypothetical protein SASPL_154135 [Salvia splendens]